MENETLLKLIAAAAVRETALSLRRSARSKHPDLTDAAFDAAHPSTVFIDQAYQELQAVLDRRPTPPPARH